MVEKSVSTPLVGILWNYYPFDLLTPWTLRYPINLFFFPFWLLSFPFSITWNSLFENTSILLWILDCFAFVAICITMFFQLFLIFLLPYLYLTSVPDLFLITIVISILAVISDGTFVFEPKATMTNDPPK